MIVFFLFACLAPVFCENIVTTEVFIIKLDPPTFNWTYEVPYLDDTRQFVYRASLVGAPDLPPWIRYRYSDRHRAGFLYGVVPDLRDTNRVLLEVIGLNRKNYETRRTTVPIHIVEKLNPALNEVHLKIDNLDVEDLFDTDRIKSLKDVFADNLWRDSFSDLYVTFMASAIELGARRPLNPSEGEGVVIRIGSRAQMSPELVKLQKEIKPLWKHKSCPREYKRTTVERIFRDAGFILDWCVFRLIEDTSTVMEQQSSTNVEHLSNNLQKDRYESEDVWQGISRDDVPKRSYTGEFAVTFLIPAFLLTIFGLMLSFILCFHHEGISDELSEDFFENIFHICTDYYYENRRSPDLDENVSLRRDLSNYATIHKATQSLRSSSVARSDKASCDLICRSNTDSPTSTLKGGIHCRPSPPPYVRPKFKPDL